MPILYDPKTGQPVDVPSDPKIMGDFLGRGFTPDPPKSGGSTGGTNDPNRQARIIDATNRELLKGLSIFGYTPSGGGELAPLTQRIIGSINFGENIEEDIAKNQFFIFGTAAHYAKQKEDEKHKKEIDDLKNPTATDDQRNSVAQLVQEELGRPARSDEVDFFSKELARGQSLFELRQFLRTSPEFQEIKDREESKRVSQESTAAREALNQELLNFEEEAFRRAQPEIIAAFMRSGRLGSSGLENAVARARADLARERQTFLAQAGFEQAVAQQGFNRADFVNRKSMAFDQFLRQNEPANQQRFALQNIRNQFAFQSPLDRFNLGLEFGSRNIGRQFELEDYGRQQNDFFRASSLASKRAKEAALYGLFGNLISGTATGLFAS